MLMRPQLLISSAQAFAARGELSALDRQLLFNDGMRPSDDGAWDTPFLHYIGDRSQMTRWSRNSTWPLPPAATAHELFQVARERGMLRDEPEPGDIFTAWSPTRKTFVRSGLIVLVEPAWVDDDGEHHHECVTIEADLNERTDCRGNHVSWARRVLSHDQGDRFIRWSEALPDIEVAA